MSIPRSVTARGLAASSLALCCLLAAGCAAGARNNAQVDRLFAQWNRADSPGAAVVIVQDGKVVYQ